MFKDETGDIVPAIVSEELWDKATSLYLSSQRKFDRKQLIESITKCFQEEYSRFEKQPDFQYLQEEYNRLLVNCGKEVVVQDGENQYKATALGINADGELLVKRDDESLETVYAGEVSVRGIYGYV
jgi:BirA family biotin operon repressor/biotin-[acetyl-CoA-carboxylase] ligase